MNWYVIIPMIISFIVVFLIGVYASRRVQATAHNKFLQEYFLGGRELGGLLLAMTMIATYGSASSFIGGLLVLLTIWGLDGYCYLRFKL